MVGLKILKKETLKIKIAVLIGGAAIMVFELVGSRLAAPFLGNSLVTWTALIGVIMISLSLGYAGGGKIADKQATVKILAVLIALAAVLILFALFIHEGIYAYLAEARIDNYVKAVLGAVAVFLPASLVLGMISPYAAKLLMKDLESAGSTVGSVSALSTVGSIIGTFITGFWLIPLAGSLRLVWGMALVLGLLAFYLWPNKTIKTYGYGFLILAIMLAIGWFRLYEKKVGEIIDRDTPYSRVKIFNIKRPGNKVARLMMIDSQASSARFLDSTEPVFGYTKYYRLADYFNHDIKKALMIGGAGYTVPRDFLARHQSAQIETVEIDAGVTELAREYFELKDYSRLKIYHEDGRFFLNRTTEKYDAIFGDAFANWAAIPWQLTSQEAVAKKYQALNEGGVVVLNIIGSVAGDNGRFLRAEYATYKKIFEQVYLFTVDDNSNAEAVQNIMLVAVKSDKLVDFSRTAGEYSEALSNLWTKEIPNDMPILTDDYAPVDWYVSKLYNR